MPRNNVLLVEDEILIRSIMMENLLDAGFEVVEAENGDEAIKILGTIGDLAVLITDIQMPGRVDGNAVAAAAKQKYPDLPVIYASGRPESLTRQLGMRDAFIRKPYGPLEVISVMKRLLNSA